MRLKWLWWGLRYRQLYISFYVQKAGVVHTVEILITRWKQKKCWLDHAQVEDVGVIDNLMNVYVSHNS